LSILLLTLLQQSHAFSSHGHCNIIKPSLPHYKSQYQDDSHHMHSIPPRQHRTTTRLSVIGTGAASLLAGSVGGAIGVGVAYPFDTLKTKSQVYSQQQSQQRQKQQSQPGTVRDLPIESPEDDLISLVKLILEVEGIGGFFGGVKAMMIGQALIKSVAFSANELALGALHDNEGLGGLLGVANDVAAAGVVDGGDGAVATSFVTLLLAASFSGFVTSFLVAPVGELVLSIVLFF
jgi:hypothetical protein